MLWSNGVDERWFLDVISGRQHGLLAAVTRWGLSMLTPCYRAGVSIRNQLFDLGWKRVHHVDVQVISVGNLTTGGTGKTPMVAWLAEWFRSQGKQPCIVSRGYRSLDEGGNDERRVLEQLCPNVPHEQNRDRVVAARRAIETHKSDVLILDDGFQHRRLSRDVDIVLIDALNPWGYGRLLPRGLLREPKASQRRANCVIVTRADQIDEPTKDRLRAEISQFTNAPIAEVAFCPQRVIDASGNTADLSSLTREKTYAFCGIGNPDSFARTLTSAGFDDVPLNAFPDHHHYTPEDVQLIESAAGAEGATALITTQKDLVKLDPTWLSMPTWAVVIGAEFLHGADQLEALLSSAENHGRHGTHGRI